MKEQNNIDEIFKQAFDKFEVDPGKDMWANVQSGVQSAVTSGSAATAAGSSTFSWVASVIVAASITAAAVGGYFYFNQKGEAKKNTSIAKSEQTPSNSSEKELTTNTKKTKEDLNKVELASGEVQTQESNDAETANSNPKKEDQKNIVAPQRTEQKNTENLNGSTGSDKEVVSEPIEHEKFNEQDVAADEKESNSNVNSSQSTEAINTNASSSSQSSQNKETTSNPNPESVELESAESIDTEKEKDIITVTIDFPNVFTPNQDGSNDKYEINQTTSVGLQLVEDARMIIQNTTGKVIYQWNGIEGSWDGSLPNGTAASEGNYFFQFTYTVDGKPQTPRKGLFTLRR